MATYVPNANQTTEPVESQPVESAALEFRTLKKHALQYLTDDADASKTTLPAATARAGKFLAFDSVTGAPVIGPDITDWTITQSQIAAIETVAADLNEPVSEIETVAASIANVDLVGPSISSVNTVALSIGDVVVVADNIAAVNNLSDAVTNGDLLTSVYQGAYAANPVLRLNGDALQNGDIYFNTSTNRMMAYASGTWYATETEGATDAALVAYTPPGTGTYPITLANVLDEQRISVLRYIPESEHAAIRGGSSVYDCTVAIQAAINTSIYNNTNSAANGLKYVVHIPAGIYRISDTIHLGYGTSFNSVFVEGDGYRYRSESGFSGTGILALFNDRPAFNFQGARGSVIRNLNITGQLYNYISTNTLGAYSGASNGIDDTVAANWIDPAFPASASSRYAPYAAITVDAYSGNKPAVSYPNVTYPAFLGAVAQYNKNYSSDVLIENVGITGFVVGIANQPCDADGNGDFTVIRRVNMDAVQYGISVGNTQSRNVGIDQVKMSNYFCALSTRTHGRQSGKLNGTISNLSVGAGIELVDINAAFAGPLTFLHLYCEAQWRIGNIVAQAATSQSIIFQSCLFAFNHTGTRGRPATIISGGQQNISLRFIGCMFSQFPSVILIGEFGSVMLDGTQVWPSERGDSPPATSYEALAHNTLSGGIVFPLGGRPAYQRIKHTVFNIDTRAAAGNVDSQDYYSAGRSTCIPYYVRNVLQPNAQIPVYVPSSAATFNKASVTDFSLSGRTLTCTLPGRADWQFTTGGGEPGDVLLDVDTYTVFFIRSRVGTTIIAEAQNNIRQVLGVWEFITPVLATGSTYYFIHGRFYTPTYYLRGTLTSGSAVITNCGRDDGYHGAYNAQIAVNDYMYLDQESDRYVGPPSNKIAARDEAAGTITLSGNSLKTQTAKRLPLFIRQGLPNV